jgi:hypothetical protein
MKQFMYCEGTRTGMDQHIIERWVEMDFLKGWGEPMWEDEDFALCDFLRVAEVGEYHEHRLGVCIRLKDKQQAGD